jgi:hypothetical protein
VVKKKTEKRTFRIPVSETKDDGRVVTSDHVLREPGGRRFGVGGIPKGQTGRKISQGPLVPGPWAFTFGLCTVIDNYGGTGAEIERNEKANREHAVLDGDIVVFDGRKYTVALTDGFGQKCGRCDYIRLIPMRSKKS